MTLKTLEKYQYPRDKDEIRIKIPLTPEGIMTGIMYRLKYGINYKPYWKVLKECVEGEEK